MVDGDLPETQEELIKLSLDKSYSLNGLFIGCDSLHNLPDISKWNIKNTQILMACLEVAHR